MCVCASVREGMYQKSNIHPPMGAPLKTNRRKNYGFPKQLEKLRVLYNFSKARECAISSKSGGPRL